ncbi:hypothetical protein [Leptospira licerasiae]|uniref:hypothetical protein n=1 Tax=Leptospira licerasiae TaxID=447106 RepID=UPI001E4D4385|nr:hypothetical protein [Leptospira licerasiae]
MKISITSHEQSDKYREVDCAFHRAYIEKKIEEYGLRGLARILKEKLGEKEAPNAGTIRNALTRDKYPPIYRISKLIKNALT